MANSLVASFVLLSLVLGLTYSSNTRVFLEDNVVTNYIPEGWEKIGEADDNMMVALLVGLEPRNRERLKELLDETGTPSSPSYGKWWTKKDVDQLMEPPAASKEIVKSWLESEGVDSIRRRTPLWWEVKMTVRQASSLLQVPFHVFSHRQSKAKLVRSLERYTVPEQVASSLTLVANVFRFPGVSQAVHPRRSTAPPYLFTITPQDLQEKYKVTVPPANTTNIQAVGSFLGQYFSENDLKDFHDDFFPTLSTDCQLTRVSIFLANLI
jgi:tripeptidyl-peptidase-1